MFKSAGLIAGILLGLALVYSPAAHAVGWAERPPSPEAKPTGIQPADAVTEVPATPPPGVLGYYTRDGGKTFVPIKEEKGVAERLPPGTTKEDFMARHEMPAEAQAAIVHQVPLVPFILGSVLYQPEEIHLFDGEQLGFTVGSDGRLYAFTSFGDLDDFLAQQPLMPSTETDPYSYFYDLINDNPQGTWMEAPQNTSISSLSSYYLDNLISSMQISAYADHGCTLFDYENYQGDYFAVNGGTSWPDLGQYGWSDRASSLIVWPQ